MKLARTTTLAALTALPVLAGVAPAFAADTPTPAPATTTTGCKTGSLPVVVDGNPDVKVQSALGVYLWHGKDGYALRVTHPGKQAVTFTGSITVSNTISTVKRVKKEKQDHVTVGPHRHTLTFRFVDHGAIDGVDFLADCSGTVKVSLAIDGHRATTGQVFLGKGRTSPTSVPFVIQRGTVTAA